MQHLFFWVAMGYYKLPFLHPLNECTLHSTLHWQHPLIKLEGYDNPFRLIYSYCIPARPLTWWCCSLNPYPALFFFFLFFLLSVEIYFPVSPICAQDNRSTEYSKGLCLSCQLGAQLIWIIINTVLSSEELLNKWGSVSASAAETIQNLSSAFRYSFTFCQVADQYEGMPDSQRSSYSLVPLCKYSVRSGRHCGNIHSCRIITLTRRVWALWIDFYKDKAGPESKKITPTFSLISLLEQPGLTTNQQAQKFRVETHHFDTWKSKKILMKQNQSSLPVWFFLCSTA